MSLGQSPCCTTTSAREGEYQAGTGPVDGASAGDRSVLPPNHRCAEAVEQGRHHAVTGVSAWPGGGALVRVLGSLIVSSVALVAENRT